MSKKHSARFLAIVESKRASVTEVSVGQVLGFMADNVGFQFIDVREREEWDSGHIDGAIHLSKGIIERDIEGVIADPTAVLVLYCGGGFRSVLAASALRTMGYSNAMSMAGGWRAWCAAKSVTPHSQ